VNERSPQRPMWRHTEAPRTPRNRLN
jgi:hypothetical protein